MSDFVYTTAIKKLRKLSKRIKVVPGGTSAGKTYGILPILIDQAIKSKGLEISVVSESVPHLRKGAIKDFLKIMKSTNRFISKNWNKTHLTYTFENGSYIEFFSADQEDKVRGPRRHVLYVNECNNLNFDTYHQLSIRTSLGIWLDFNPSNEFWAHEELSNEGDAEWLTLTYLDNEALPESIVREIEKAKAKAEYSDYWRNWWNVYGKGELGRLEGVVFNDYSLIDTIPPEAAYVGSGLDFGFSNDPAVLIDVYKWNGRYIFDEVIYRTGLLNNELATLIRADNKKRDIIYADSAEPKSIKDLRNSGINVKAATKGPDSIRFGISEIQKEHFYVTKNSTNLIKELRSYAWDKDRDGKVLNKPIDAFNHCLDSARYYVQSVALRRKSLKVRKR